MRVAATKAVTTAPTERLTIHLDCAAFASVLCMLILMTQRVKPSVDALNAGIFPK